MISISEVLRDIIQKSPFLEEGISEGIVNLSALARKVRPRIEKSLMKDVSDSAILMALKRMVPEVKSKADLTQAEIQQLGDITVRSDLSEFTFLKSGTILEKQKSLLHEVKSISDYFITFTQGVYEITIIISSNHENTVEKIFSREKELYRKSNLSAMTIRLSAQSVNTPGVHYSILKQLAWNNINIIEVVSTYTEFTIILHKSQIDISFSVLMKYLET
ncbi:MAG: aspartate kinase [Candidatus Aminicenantaceae bacterium]